MADSATTEAQSSESLTKSPIGQLLQSLGLTREDLTRHSAQMREFLTTENASSLRALTQENKLPRPQSLPPNRSESPLSRTSSVARDLSRTNSMDAPGRHATPPPASSSLPQHGGNLSFVHNPSQSSTRKPEKSHAESIRQGKTRHKRTSSFASPTRPKPNLDMIMQMRSRDSRRVQESDDSESSDESPISVRDTCFKTDNASVLTGEPRVHFQPPSIHPNQRIHFNTSPLLKRFVLLVINMSLGLISP